ncbi:hypothetical protein CIHG_08989 [Coccidioides immitis H538.4]|uniref:Uncharacterized protein n=1 Tax=Coccidioides immitis H538.4 TaxID=396776 RepID=A0A0J8S3X2_COCIT|nr:hypothetical protein CIHG_08989 [Coccidioides immitis H538.4]
MPLPAHPWLIRLAKHFGQRLILSVATILDLPRNAVLTIGFTDAGEVTAKHNVLRVKASSLNFHANEFLTMLGARWPKEHCFASGLYTLGFPAYKDRRTTSPRGTWVVRFRVLKGYWEKKSCKDDEPCAHRELRVLYYDANTSRVKWVYGSAGRSFDRKRKQIKIKIKRRLPFATNVASNASTGPSHAANSGVSIPAAQRLKGGISHMDPEDAVCAHIESHVAGTAPSTRISINPT